MAIFSGSQRETAAPEIRRRNDSTSLSIVSKDLTIVGDLSTAGVVKVEGTVEGTIRAGSQILIAPGAVIRGDLHTAEAVIGGEVFGTVHATDRVEVQATAVLKGDVVTPRIAILEGGKINGEVRMGAEASEPVVEEPWAAQTRE
jgi:cytoskeletal protein CcmA (bactofilin family)